MTRTLPIRVGILGAGYTATRHAQGYRALGLVPFVVLGKRPERAAAFQHRFEIPHLAQSLDEFLSLRPDAVSICTPTPTHREMIAACLREGIPVLVEKPVLEDERDDTALSSLVKPGAFVMAGHTELFQPSMRRVMTLLDKGALGAVRAIDLRKVGRDASPKGDDLAVQDSTPQSVQDHLVHLLYLVHRAAGHTEPWTVTERSLTFEEGRAFFSARLRNKTALPVDLTLDERPNHPLRKVLTVRTERGLVQWSLADGRVEAVVTLGGQTRRLPDTSGESFTEMTKEFLSCVQDSRLPKEDLRAGTVVGNLARVLVFPVGTTEAVPGPDHHNLGELSFAALMREAQKRHSETERDSLVDDVLQRAERFDPTDATMESRIKVLFTLIRRHADRQGMNWLNLQALLAILEQRPNLTAEEIERELSTAPPEDGVREAVFRFDIACNQRCLFCNVMTPVHHEIRHTPEEALAALRILREDGYNALTLTGGEPTLRKDLANVIAYAKESGFRLVNLQTNAVRLAERALCESLVTAGLDRAMVSLHSHRAEISDGLTQTPGSFEKTVQGIRNLTESGVSVGLSHVITTHNVDDLIPFVRFVIDELPRVNRLDLMLNQHMGAGKDRPDLLPSFDQVEPHLPEAIRLALDHGMAVHNALTIPPCRFGGRVDLTLEYARLRQFELEGKTFDTQTDLVRREKTKAPSCRRCVLDPYCYGVWKGYADVHGLDDLRPLRKEDIRHS